jgi:diguanylate cyclase (GGDEF)-like protein
VPILVENEAIGVLNAADRQDDHPFTDDDLQSAEMVARSMAAVLHSDLLAQRARDGGEIDPVTGLYNARHFEKRLTQEVERALRARLPLTLLLLGVSSYDDIAKRVGVQAAGVLMRSIGEIVAQSVRQSDVLACRSESEIAVLLPSTPLDKARRVARTIAREVVHDRLPAALRYDLESLHVSIGLAALGPGMPPTDLVAQAMLALDQAVTRGDTIVAAAGDDIVEVPRRTPPSTMQQQSIVTALRLGVPYLANPADAATFAAIQLVSRDMARTHLCFPIAVESGTLTLAMADPVDAAAIEAVSQRTRLAVFPVASPREKILQAIATRMGEHDVERVSLDLQAERGLQAVIGRLEALDQAFPALRDDALIIDTTLRIQASSSQHRATLADAETWLRHAPENGED